MIGAIIAKRNVRSAFDALNRRDLPKFLENWAEDAIYVYPGNLSVSGTIKGRKGIEEWFKKFMEQFTKANFTLKNICVQNIFAFGGTNVVTAEWDCDITTREGKSYQNSGVEILSIKNGKVIFVRDYHFDHEILKKCWGEE